MIFHRKYIKLITKVMQSGQVVGEELHDGPSVSLSLGSVHQIL